MATPTDPDFEAHLDWAFGTDDELVMERGMAEFILNQRISAEDKAILRKRIESLDESAALANEAEVIKSNQHRDPDDGWNAKWVPILDKEVNDMQDDEVFALDAFRLVLTAYIYAMKSFRTQIEQILSTYTDLNLSGAFDNAVNQRLSQLNTIVGDGAAPMNQLAWVNRVCSIPEFKARLPADKPPTWVPAIKIDEGVGKPQDKLWIWLAFDDKGRVVDRYVEKWEMLPEPGWSKPKYWAQSEDGSKVPKEAYLQNKCWAVDNTAFVKVRESTISAVQHWIKYKVEYCPCGDLSDLWSDYSNSNIPVPEPILWMVFQRLVEQCLIMDRGTKALGNAAAGWKTIVHRDLKPENIFLDHPSKDGFFPEYPTPKMADFGFAFETSKEDRSNPRMWTGEGTRPYLAPEQREPTIRRTDGGGPETAYQLLGWTNVWGIGMIMLQLTNGDGIWNQRDNNYVANSRGEMVVRGHRPSAFAMQNYSKGLLNLIVNAIEPFPDKRVDAETLYGWIIDDTYGMKGAPGDIGAYCAAAAQGTQPSGGGAFQWQRAAEKYKLHMASDT